jgi:hypothetical protein
MAWYCCQTNSSSDSRLTSSCNQAVQLPASNSLAKLAPARGSNPCVHVLLRLGSQSWSAAIGLQGVVALWLWSAPQQRHTVETIQRIQRPIQWRHKYSVCSLGVRRRCAGEQSRGMGLSRWAGAHDVGVCDVQWASDGLQGFKSEAVDPSKVRYTSLTARESCCADRSTGSTECHTPKHCTSCLGAMALVPDQRLVV